MPFPANHSPIEAELLPEIHWIALLTPRSPPLPCGLGSPLDFGCGCAALALSCTQGFDQCSLFSGMLETLEVIHNQDDSGAAAVTGQDHRATCARCLADDFAPLGLVVLPIGMREMGIDKRLCHNG